MDGKTNPMLENLLDSLERHYGKVKVPHGEPLLETAAFLILRDGWDYKKASRALKILETDFVDWNEVRVSTSWELANHLSSLADGAQLEPRCERLLYLLDRVYEDRSELSLEFLTELDADQRREYLLTVEQLDVGQAFVLLQLMAPEGELVMGYPAVRMGGTYRDHPEDDLAPRWNEDPREAPRFRGLGAFSRSLRHARREDLPVSQSALRRVYAERGLQERQAPEGGSRFLTRSTRLDRDLKEDTRTIEARVFFRDSASGRGIVVEGAICGVVPSGRRANEAVCSDLPPAWKRGPFDSCVRGSVGTVPS